MKVCSALHLEQQLVHAIKNKHFSIDDQLIRLLPRMLEVIISKDIHGFNVSDTTGLWKLEISFNALILRKF